MKQYSIFLLESGEAYPIFQTEDGKEFYLGGNGLKNLLFSNKAIAEKTARLIRKTDRYFARNGKIKVLRAKITASNYK